MGALHYMFPLAFAMNTFSMTAFMVILGLSGNPSLAADFGIVHGATMALFYAFSANARNLILNPSSKTSVRLLLQSRLFLIPPLGAASIFLSVSLAGAYWPLALILIIRRSTEWIAELHLSEMEYRERRSFAKVFVLVHSFLLVFAILWGLTVKAYPLLGTALWAILPMALHVRFIPRTLASKGDSEQKWVHIYPHFGSTAITGVTVYVFRLLLLLLVGRVLAGDLYTAYAIGGFMGTAYLNALGPTLALREGVEGRIFFPSWLKALLCCLFVAGACLFILAERKIGSSALFGKSSFFWGATGLSMIGGTLMVLAQRIRIGLLQLAGDRDVFGPDLIINVFIIALVPFSFYLFGKDILKTLFLCNAFIACFFYSSAKGGILSKIRRKFPRIADHYFYMGIAFVLVFPLFFQLTGKIFNDPAFPFDSQGILTRLPIPISVFACFGGLFLIGAYERARLSICVIFLTFILMLGTTIVLSNGYEADEKAKLIFLIQFILPFFGLVLGQMYEKKNSYLLVFAKAAVFVLLLIVPTQLIFTYFHPGPYLYSHLYFFSIYQPLEYISTIFACLYVFALHSLWDNKAYKALLIFFTPLMGIYLVLSTSALALVILTLGLFSFLFLGWFKRYEKLALTVALLVICSSASSLYFLRNTYYIQAKYSFLRSTSSQVAKETEQGTPNLDYRLRVWNYYINGIKSDFEKLLFGHTTRPPREQFPSAHNYYLDLAYNFGLLATIPILGLLILTIRELFRTRRQIFSNSTMAGLVLVTLFLLLIDNSLKVGLRQPYPGIITFFLWGLLLSRLSNSGTKTE